jgi:hypothetical protein
MRRKLEIGESVMFDESVRLGRSMESLHEGKKDNVEVDWRLRIVIVRQKSGKTVVIPFENVRFITAEPPAETPTRAREAGR